MDELLVTEQGTDNQTFRDACYVRRTVFCAEQGVDPDNEFDELEEASFHSALYVDGEPIACGRLFVEGQVGRIGRLAVLKEYRKKGYAAKICNNYLDMARQKNLESMYLHAQTHAIPFYEKLGFVAEGEEFMEEGIPHVFMRLAHCSEFLPLT